MSLGQKGREGSSGRRGSRSGSGALKRAVGLVRYHLRNWHTMYVEMSVDAVSGSESD
ncbi:MAG: hypothetical protein SV253_09895 [Halobacteria archaeon]|nr:hypothetical protein [Halobacteria archaeon]